MADFHRLLVMKKMGWDIPDSLINLQLFRSIVPPSQGSRTNTPFTPTRISSSQAALNQRPRNTATSGFTTQTDTNPTRTDSPYFSALFPNPTPGRSTNTNNNYMYQIMNPFFLAMMENFVWMRDHRVSSY